MSSYVSDNDTSTTDYLWWNWKYHSSILVWRIQAIVFIPCFIVILFMIGFVLYWRYQSFVYRRQHRKQQHSNDEDDGIVIAFFHPYCSSGGGGERVLWKMIQVIDQLINQCNNDNAAQKDKSTSTTKTNTTAFPYKIKQVIIYTIDPYTSNYKEQLLQHVHERFDVSLKNTTIHNTNQQEYLQFVHLPEYKYLLQPSSILSLLVESIGTMRLAYIALRKVFLLKNDIKSELPQSKISLPDLFIDTMGCSFTYIPAYVLFNCTVMPYVHYPTISTDMLQLVYERRTVSATFDKNRNTNLSIVKTYVKLVYYCMFAYLYGIIGSTCCTMVLVNSTWTYNHIVSLWYKRWFWEWLSSFKHKNPETTTKIKTESDKNNRNNTMNTTTTTTTNNTKVNKTIRIVYPPCNVKDLIQQEQLLYDKNQPPNKRRKRIPAIVSIGQFRPEKDHKLQLDSFAKLFELYPQHYQINTVPKDINHNNENNDYPKLVLIGSCRGIDDEQRLHELKEYTNQLQLKNHVEFVVNQPYSVVQQWLTTGTVGIHTMWNEHFGIGIVEMMAAGLLTIAHNSGGPKLDIIQTYGNDNGTNRMDINVDGTRNPRNNSSITGFLATTPTEYSSCIHQALNMNDTDAALVRTNAQQSTLRFSDQVFAQSFQQVLSELKL